MQWRSCMHVPPISTGTSITTPLTEVSSASVPRDVSGQSTLWPGRFVREPSALTAAGSADGNPESRHRPRRLMHAICEVAKVAVKYDHQKRLLIKEGTRRLSGTNSPCSPGQGVTQPRSGSGKVLAG